MPNLLENLDEQLSQNLEKHGHYLTDPHAAEVEKLNEAIATLAAFVPEERWPDVRQQLLKIITDSQVPRSGA